MSFSSLNQQVEVQIQQEDRSITPFYATCSLSRENHIFNHFQYFSACRVSGSLPDYLMNIFIKRLYNFSSIEVNILCLKGFA